MGEEDPASEDEDSASAAEQDFVKEVAQVADEVEEDESDDDDEDEADEDDDFLVSSEGKLRCDTLTTHSGTWKNFWKGLTVPLVLSKFEPYHHPAPFKT